MRMSKMLMPTLKEVPSDAEITSHQLMLRAGMIRKMASGIYNQLPMGIRVFRKVEDIIREEMNAKGAQEISCALLVPAELWQESGRWDVMGPEMFRLKDRNGRDYCLGKVAHAYVAQDADLLLTKRVVDRCYDMDIPCTQVESMEKLGRACGIDVKAAAAGLLK